MLVLLLCCCTISSSGDGKPLATFNSNVHAASRLVCSCKWCTLLHLHALQLKRAQARSHAPAKQIVSVCCQASQHAATCMRGGVDGWAHTSVHEFCDPTSSKKIFKCVTVKVRL